MQYMDTNSLMVFVAELIVCVERHSCIYDM